MTSSTLIAHPHDSPPTTEALSPETPSLNAAAHSIPSSSVAFAADFMRRFETRKTSLALGYFLLGILGIYGGHRFYLGKTGSAVAMLCITVCSILSMIILIGFVTIWITLIWAIIDACLLPGIVRNRNLQLIDDIERSMVM